VSLRHLQAPAADGALLAEPPLAEAGGLIDVNHRRLAAALPDLLGRSWIDLRQHARAEALTAAESYLQRAGEPLPSAARGPLIVSGHQPELFHPGVWLKSFVVHGLARQNGGCAMNLLVDTDTVKSIALRIPAYRPPPLPSPRAGEGKGGGEAEPDHAVAVTVPFDRWTGEVPYEERAVADEALFADFPERARPLFDGWGFDPMLEPFWADVRRLAGVTPLLGERLAGGRRFWERRWGCHNLEVPVSALCQTPAFAWFVCHLLMHLPRFHSDYNHCLHEYRCLYGVRSRNHPVPDLAREDDWLEAPFWAWRRGARRSRLLIRRRGQTLESRIGDDAGPAFPCDAGQPDGLVAAWLDQAAQGLKVRTRALTTTLYARLFLADLFVHGLGGAKYDEVTDAIIRRFYEIEPPRYLTLTATLRLPLPLFPATDPECQALARQLRDVRYNPQRYLGRSAAADARVRELVARKEEWITRRPDNAEGRRQRYRALRALTDALRPYVAEQEERLRQELSRCVRQLRSNAVLRRRDYAFCLYPPALLGQFLRRFL
jgi:hypothetical protein